MLQENNMPFKYAVALTGGIATGKSTVAGIFFRLGFRFIDADTIAHGVIETQHTAIAELFGANMIQGGRVDRKALGSVVFSDAQKRQALEALLHPLIREEIARHAAKQDSMSQPYLIDIPLFFEREMYPIERSIVVYAPRKIQIMRLMQREGYSQAEALQRLDAQMDIEDKRQRATWVIDNQGDLSELQAECERVRDAIHTDFGTIPTR
jgi:dephospho-CoA kinase